MCKVPSEPSTCWSQRSIHTNKNRSAEPEPLSSLNLKLTDRRTDANAHTKVYSNNQYMPIYILLEFLCYIRFFQSLRLQDAPLQQCCNRRCCLAMYCKHYPCLLSLILNTSIQSFVAYFFLLYLSSKTHIKIDLKGRIKKENPIRIDPIVQEICKIMILTKKVWI